MRVVLISQVPQAVQGLAPFLSAAGHEPVALLCSREHAGRYGNAFDVLLRDAPPALDIVIHSRREGIAPLLRRYEPDAVVCVGFPWKIPPDALDVPKLAAIIAANARYGLTSPPGMRVSTRREAPCPTSRKPQVRLS